MTKAPLTEKSNSATQNIDLMNGYEIAQTINNEDKKVALAIEKTLPQIGEAIELIAKAFHNGGRLAYFGAGTSGRLGVLDASECYPTFGVDENMVQGFIAGGKEALSHSVENAEDKKDTASDVHRLSGREAEIGDAAHRQKRAGRDPFGFFGKTARTRRLSL